MQKKILILALSATIIHNINSMTRSKVSEYCKEGKEESCKNIRNLLYCASIRETSKNSSQKSFCSKYTELVVLYDPGFFGIGEKFNRFERTKCDQLMPRYAHEACEILNINDPKEINHEAEILTGECRSSLK